MRFYGNGGSWTGLPDTGSLPWLVAAIILNFASAAMIMVLLTMVFIIKLLFSPFVILAMYLLDKYYLKNKNRW